jgi:hypothetical protein
MTMDAAYGLARDLDRSLGQTRDLALALTIAAEFSLDHRAKGGHLDVARDVARKVMVCGDRVGDLTNLLIAWRPDGVPARASGSAVAAAVEIAGRLTEITDLMGPVFDDDKCTDDLVRDRAGATLSQLRGALSIAREVAGLLSLDLAPAIGQLTDRTTNKPARKTVGGRGRNPATRSAVKVVAVAVRILPAKDRPRFDEEFRSELYYLASAGASRMAQLRYALNQVNRAFEHRTELLRPARRSVRT